MPLSYLFVSFHHLPFPIQLHWNVDSHIHCSFITLWLFKFCFFFLVLPLSSIFWQTPNHFLKLRSNITSDKHLNSLCLWFRHPLSRNWGLFLAWLYHTILLSRLCWLNLCVCVAQVYGIVGRNVGCGPNYLGLCRPN